MALDTIFTFSRLEEVASYLLHEAFRYAYIAADAAVAEVLFERKLPTIAGPTSNTSATPPVVSLSAYLAMRDSDEHFSITEDYMGAIREVAEAWEYSRREASSGGIKIPKTTRLTSGYMVHHAIMLASCVETVVNRHLFHLSRDGRLERHLYQSLDRAELMPKIMFAFKEPIEAKRLPTSNIKKLITLRNHAVHYKEASTEAIQPTAEDLLRIWREVAQLFGFIEGTPTANEVLNYSSEFATQWLESTSGDKK